METRDLKCTLKEVEMTSNFIECVLCDACMGGVFGIFGETDSSSVAQKLIDGGAVVVVDFEDDDKEYSLTLSMLQKGMRKMFKDDFYSFCNIYKEDYDVTDAENLLQYALFGEEVYG